MLNTALFTMVSEISERTTGYERNKDLNYRNPTTRPIGDIMANVYKYYKRWVKFSTYALFSICFYIGSILLTQQVTS